MDFDADPLLIFLVLIGVVMVIGPCAIYRQQHNQKSVWADTQWPHNILLAFFIAIFIRWKVNTEGDDYVIVELVVMSVTVVMSFIPVIMAYKRSRVLNTRRS